VQRICACRPPSTLAAPASEIPWLATTCQVPGGTRNLRVPRRIEEAPTCHWNSAAQRTPTDARCSETQLGRLFRPSSASLRSPMRRHRAPVTAPPKGRVLTTTVPGRISARRAWQVCAPRAESSPRLQVGQTVVFELVFLQDAAIRRSERICISPSLSVPVTLTRSPT